MSMKLIQRLLQNALVARRMRAQIAFTIRFGREIAQQVVLMVTHDDISLAGIDHGADDMQRLTYMGATINNIANKNNPSMGVSVNTVYAPVAHSVQQQTQTDSTTVHITDQVYPASFFSHQHTYSPSFVPHPNFSRHVR